MEKSTALTIIEALGESIERKNVALDNIVEYAKTLEAKNAQLVKELKALKSNDCEKATPCEGAIPDPCNGENSNDECNGCGIPTAEEYYGDTNPNPLSDE